MSTLALPAAHAPSISSALWPLARLEVKRYARHPLFLVGLLVGGFLSTTLSGPIELDFQVIPSFFIGVLGIIVAYRLMVSMDRSGPVIHSAPVTDTLRTAALCLACAVPTVAGLAVVLLHRAFVVADPFPAWMYGTYNGTDRNFITLVIPVIACAGGPLLGVCAGRWLRFPGAALLTVIVVLVWCNVASYSPVQKMDTDSLAARILHLVTPYTAWASSNGDGEHPATIVTSHTGSPVWFAGWTLALCVIAAATALRRGAQGRTRVVVGRAVAVAAVVGLIALTLAIAGGNSGLYDTSPSGTVPVDTPASAQ